MKKTTKTRKLSNKLLLSTEKVRDLQPLNEVSLRAVQGGAPNSGGNDHCGKTNNTSTDNC